MRFEVFLLIFGALVVFVPMLMALTAERVIFAPGEVKGIVIAGAAIAEAGLVMGILRRRKAGKDITFRIGACIGVLLVAIWQLL